MSVPHERRTRTRVFGFSVLASLFAILAALWGCATPLLVAGATSAALTGKGLHDHAISGVTQKDCSSLEGLVREDRKICEERNSSAAKRDFDGILGFFEGRKEARVYEGEVETREPVRPVQETYRAPAASEAIQESEPMFPPAAAAPVAQDTTRLATAETGVTSDFYDLGQPYAVFDKSGYVGVRVIPQPVKKPL